MEIQARFKAGDTVTERLYPLRKLVISNYKDGIYYCRAQENRHLKALVYFERDLMALAGPGKVQ
jgi:hypothetical protein